MTSTVKLVSGAEMPTVAMGMGTKWFHREGVPDQDDALEASLLGTAAGRASPFPALLGTPATDTSSAPSRPDSGYDRCAYVLFADALEKGVRHIDMAGGWER